MIDDPGWRSGRLISPRPARGPEPIQRRSFAIFVRLMAMVRSCPESSTSASRAPWASKWSRASVSGRPVAAGHLADDSPAETGRRVDAGPDRRSPEGQLGHAGQRGPQPFDAHADLRGVAAELLAERDRRRVHEVRPPGLDDVGELRRPSPRARRRDARAPARGRAPRRLTAAMWIDAGKRSFDDIGWLTSSFGWTGRPSRSAASVASTSFMFMLLLVPEPVWNTSIGNWSSCSPAATASAAAAIASARSASIMPSARLTDATAAP